MPLDKIKDPNYVKNVLDTDVNKSVEYGVKQNPQAFAQTSKAAKSLEIPVELAERQPDEIKRVAKERDILNKIKDTSYVKKAMANPDFAAVAHDDVDGLVKTEASIKAIRGPEASFSSISEGLMKSLPQGLELARQGIRMQWADLIGSERMYKDALRKYEAAQTDVIISQPEFESSTAQGIYSGATSFVRQTPGLAASIITRNPAPMLAGMGQMTEAEAYGKYRARGGTKLEALTGGMLEGAVEVGTELMPMKFLVDKFGKTGLGDFLTGILAREVPGEQIATIVQDAVDTAIANPDKTWGEYFSERPDAAYQTLLATLTNSGIMGTIHYGASRFSGGVYNADKAIEDKQALDNTVKAVSEVQLRNTAPEVFEQFLDEQLGADNNVFISPEDAEVFFQSNPEIFDKLPEEVSEAIKDSIGLGADVVIPKSQYLTYFPEYHDQLADVLRNDQDGFTAKEADEFVKEGQQVFEKEAEKMLVEQEKQSEFNLSAQKVRQDIKSQILKTGRFKEDVADQYAALHEAFAKTVAQKTGKMPYEAYFEMGPDIKGAPIAGEKLDQDQRTKQRQQPVLKKEDEVWVYKEGEEGEREAFKGLIIDPGKEESIVSINDQWETIPNAQLDLVDEGKLFQSGPTFYSGLEKAVTDLKQEKGTPDQMLALIKKQAGVKQEEIDWLGLEDFIKGRDKITKQEILDFVKQGGVQVDEVMKGEDQQYKEALNKFTEANDALADEYGIKNTLLYLGEKPNLDMLPDERSRELVMQLREANAFLDKGQKPDETKFREYQLPGGENYRELLLTLPSEKQPSVGDFAQKMFGKKITELSDDESKQLSEEMRKTGGWGKDVIRRKAIEIYGEKSIDNVSEGQIRDVVIPALNRDGDSFKSAHFDEPNILAHIRFNERTDAEGKRVLFIEEIQSDWHQKGRKEGYDSGQLKKQLELAQKELSEAEQAYDERVKSIPQKEFIDMPLSAVQALPEAERVVVAKEKVFSLQRKDAVPDAPFKTTWPLLSMKRMIRYAAENGFDRIAWTTGEQQAERYDLSKQVDSIKYDPQIEELEIWVKDRERPEYIKAPEDKLEDYIGKEATEKLLKSQPESSFRYIEGIDLKVGGEGMKGFYDKILPSTVNKYVKKWGGKVGEASLKMPSTNLITSSHLLAAAEDFHKNDYTLEKAKEGMKEAYPNAVEQEIDNALKYFYPSEINTVHSVDITDQMRTAAMQGQALFQKERGFYQPDQNIIGLLEDADLSTFLHETGHFFLEFISRMPEFAEEMDSTLKWMMLDRETWGAMSLEDKREYHEQFARGFEAYLLEGKSPSLELRSVFQRFRDWLINIYKSLRNLNVQLTPEIRQVFDRLLATDEQIREAEAARAYDSLFESIEESGMTEKQWTEYQRLNIERREEAREELQTRSLKDMKWMSNAKAKALRDIQRDVKAKRADIRKQVSDDVSRETVYQAIRFLRRGETVQDDGSVIVADTHRLDIDTLSEMFPYGEDIDIPDWRALGHGKYGMLQKEGLDPDEVAHNLKYSSADLMIRDILDAPDQKEYIEALTDQRMLETYGDISSPEAMAHAADEAIHNDVHTRFLHTELKILSKGQKDKNILARAAKQYAEQAIDKKKIRDIKAAQYLAAQTRAGNNALKALGKGDRESALDHKRAQVLNNHFFRAANNAEKYVEKKLRYLKKFAKEGTRKNIDQEYLEQIDDLLGSFDIKAVSLKEIDKRQSLQEFIQQQEENGFQPIIDPVLVETAKRQHYKNMPLEQFRGLVETIEHIDHLGRLKNKLLTAKDKRDFAQRIEEANRSIELLANRTVKERATPNDVFGKLGLWARQTIAMHRKFASIIREMDGNKDGGIMWNLLLRTMNESGDNEIEMHAQATERLGELFSKLDIRSGAGNLYARSYTIPNTDISLTDEQRIMVAMNWGNEGNRQRLLDGGVPGKVKLTEMEAHEILNTLTKSEWDFVQGVWDFLEEYRTQVGEQEKRLTGKTPEWVEPSSIETKYGTYRGGYFPAKYDVHLSERASELEASTDLRMAMKGAFNAAATRSGYAKERAQKVEGRHLLLSFDTISQHVSEVTHRLAWQDWVTDANRVLRALTPKIKEHYGNELLQEMKKSVKDIAADGATEKNAWMASLNYLRVGTTIVGMGYRITTAIIQPTGFAQSVFRVGKGWMAVGLKEYLKSPLKLSQTINEKSKLMRDRDRTMQREINEVLTKIRGNNQLNLVKANAFLFISKVQRTVDLPTWWGAYEKALSQMEYETAVSQEQREEIESRAIGMADQAVIDSQSGGQLKDLAAIQRGNAFQKLWTNFYSYFSATYNLNVEAFRRTDFKSPKSIGAFAGDLALLNIVPVLMTVAIKEAFKNDCDGDMECITDKVKEEQLSYIMGLSPITRELTEGVKPLFGLKSYGYQGPPGLRAFSDFYKFGQQASQGEFDEAFRKSALNLTGELTHLPLGQVNTIIDGLMAIENGEVKGGRTVLAPLVGPPRE